MDCEDAPTTSELVRRLRVEAGLSAEAVATAAGVEEAWLTEFESGRETEALTYELLLKLIRATQPPRPSWWDEGHEHDLHLGAGAVASASTTSAKDYWARIDSVRQANRTRRGSG